MRKSKREVGFEYEEIAKNYLEERNLLFVESNYYTKYGEIDLIFLEKSSETLVFVEVKYRKNNIYGEAVEAVDKRKQEKIIQSSQIYISKNKWKNGVRYDVIGIIGNKLKNDINWIKNAFWGDKDEKQR